MGNLCNNATGVLYTDFYQLSMAQLYFRQGLHETRAQFDHFFRSYPDYGGHRAGFCVNAGMATLVDWLRAARFTDDAIDAVAAHRDRRGDAIFRADFLDWLRGRDLLDGLTVTAIPEGRVVHPNEPLTVVTGPLAMAQILESPLLNILNYQTLIATKASRIKEVAGDSLVLDFGLRRAQGFGASAGTRGALIGGADFSSAVGASHALGLPAKGTHGHSLIQAFMALGEGEHGAFEAYADAYPDDCLLLVDTIDTLGSGIPNAIRVFENLRARGHRPVCIRLDSGNLADLAVRSDRMLADAGFPDLSIVLSDSLDERVITRIHADIRRIASGHAVDADDLIGRLAYGVGTRLITSAGHAALDGVYKLTGIVDNGEWRPTIKVSESVDKVPNPGGKSVWRIVDGGEAAGDLITLDDERPLAADPIESVDQIDRDDRQTLAPTADRTLEPLIEPVIIDGDIRSDAEPIDLIRRRRIEDIARLPLAVTDLTDPTPYPVRLSPVRLEMEARERREIRGPQTTRIEGLKSSPLLQERGRGRGLKGPAMPFNYVPPSTVDVPDIPYDDTVSLPAATTAVIVVDMQNDFVKPNGTLVVESAAGTIPSIAKLIADARAAGAKVAYTQDAHPPGDREFDIWPEHCLQGTWGCEIIDELAPEAGDLVCPKSRYDGFYGTSLEHYLSRIWQVDHLVVTGTVANICVAHTAGSAGLRWFNLVIPADGISALTEFDQAQALRQVTGLYAGQAVKSVDAISFD